MGDCCKGLPASDPPLTDGLVLAVRLSLPSLLVLSLATLGAESNRTVQTHAAWLKGRSDIPYPSSRGQAWVVAPCECHREELLAVLLAAAQ